MDRELAERVKNAPRAFYINLGRGGGLAKESISGGHLVIGFPQVSHETAFEVYEKEKSLAKDCIRDEITGCSKIAPQTAGKYASQIVMLYTGDFYHSKDAGISEDSLWITFWNMRLWWTFAEGKAKPGRDLSPESYVGANVPGNLKSEFEGPGKGPKHPDGYPWDYHWRETSGWCDKSLFGDVLYLHRLGWMLTVNGGFTIKHLDDRALCYLQKVILGADTLMCASPDEEGEVSKLLVHRLNSGQMEWFVDRLFCEPEWERISPLGGNQKDIDLVVKNKETGVLAFIQVKTRTSVGAWEHFVRVAGDFCEVKKNKNRSAEFYFIYHTSDDEGDGYCLDKLRNKLVDDFNNSLGKSLGKTITRSPLEIEQEVKSHLDELKKQAEPEGMGVNKKARKKLDKAAARYYGTLRTVNAIDAISETPNVKIHAWNVGCLVKKVGERDDLYEWLKERVGLSRWEA